MRFLFVSDAKRDVKTDVKMSERKSNVVKIAIIKQGNKHYEYEVQNYSVCVFAFFLFLFGVAVFFALPRRVDNMVERGGGGRKKEDTNQNKVLHRKIIT